MYLNIFEKNICNTIMKFHKLLMCSVKHSIQNQYFKKLGAEFSEFMTKEMSNPRRSVYTIGLPNTQY